jgi:hypothetical protein
LGADTINRDMGRRATKGKTEKPTVPIRKESKDKLVDWLTAHDRPEMQLIVGKVIEWFVDRDARVQRVILGGVDEGMENAYADQLEEMARALREREPNPTRGVSKQPRRKMSDLAVVD